MMAPFVPCSSPLPMLLPNAPPPRRLIPVSIYRSALKRGIDMVPILSNVSKSERRGILVLLFLELLNFLPVTKSYPKFCCQYFAAFSCQVTFRQYR